MSDLPPRGTYRRWAYDFLSPAPFKGYWGQRLMGVFSLAVDSIVDAATQAVTSHWVQENPPDDGVAIIGKEFLLERYPTETAAQFKARVQRAWDDWEIGGMEAVIIGQLEASGNPDAEIYRWGPNAATFTVFFPFGSHGVTGPGPLITGGIGTFIIGDGTDVGASLNAFTIGDGTIIGPEGITPVELNTIRQIIDQWKPGAWVCQQIVWEVSGWTIGTGHMVGEADLEVGGELASAGAF